MEGFTELGGEAEAAAKRPPTSLRLLRAALETEQLLARSNPAHPDHGKSGMTFKSTLSAAALEHIAFDASAPVEFRAFALAMMPAEISRKHATKLAEWPVTPGTNAWDFSSDRAFHATAPGDGVYHLNDIKAVRISETAPNLR